MFYLYHSHLGCSHFESWIEVDVISCNFPNFLHENVEIVLKWVIIAAFPICHSESVSVMCHKPV